MLISISKSIYEPKSKSDGYRILVMQYWPRGVKRSKIDLWLRGLGTSKELIKLWKAKKIRWTELKRQYLAELDDHKKSILHDLARKSKNQKITLLCSCRDPMRCHRSILQEEIEKLT